MTNSSNRRVVLTGFMGVGKSSVARHLSGMLGCERIDLDLFIEESERSSIAKIFDSVGEKKYRVIETTCLRQVLEINDLRVLSLGGGTWTIAENRALIRTHGMTSVWLESTFEHCWYNIRFSKKDRPLARNKRNAKRLFEERQGVYCLADWHFVIKPEFTSYDVARQINEQIFS